MPIEPPNAGRTETFMTDRVTYHPVTQRLTETYTPDRRVTKKRRSGGTAKAGVTETTAVSGEDALPRSQPITIIAQDPLTKAYGSTKTLRATVPVPTDVLAAGPRTHRFHVVDYNVSKNVAGNAVDFRPPTNGDWRRNWIFEDRFTKAADGRLLKDHGFYAQNVYAVASRVLATFESALGRRLPWSFDSHHLYLVPDAFEGANAYYSADNHGIAFGYFSDSDGRVIHACLSHDVIAHETTHAVLDGIRSRFMAPGLPDQLGFHEGFADIIALLSVFSMPDVVRQCLHNVGVKGGMRPTLPTLKDSQLFGLAEHFGGGLADGHGATIRESVRRTVPANWREDDDGEFFEPHNRGEIIVSAVLKTLLDIWQKRIRKLDANPGFELIVDEGVKAAEHLLSIVIRALDYCTPVEFEFDDFLDAILNSDTLFAPDDSKHGYRASLTAQFNAVHVSQPEGRTLPLYKDPPVYNTINFGEFLIHSDEVYRFIWENADRLEIDAEDYYTRVTDVQPSIRVGPDGFVIHETIACYVQALEGRLGDLATHSRRHTHRKRIGGRGSRDSLRIPEGMTKDSAVQLSGGGVLIFDQFGRPKLHQRKDLCDWTRQNVRLTRLARGGVTDAQGRYGFSDAAWRSSYRFHEPGRRPRREW